MWIRIPVVLCLLLVASADAVEMQVEDGQGPVRVNAEHIIRGKVRIDAVDFSRLSAHLYGGDTSFEMTLRKLNPHLEEGKVMGEGGEVLVRYPAPQVRLSSGSSLQELGARYAGGSARSYLDLLPLNPEARDQPDRVPSGTWITLPRIPTEEEKRDYLAHWSKNLPQPAAKPAPAQEPTPKSPSRAMEPAPASPFLPVTGAEKQALVEWYLERLDPKKDRRRIEAMLADLGQSISQGWKAHYLIGRFYYQVSDVLRARDYLERAFEDPAAPVQVGLFLIRSLESADAASSASLKERIYTRYPALQGLMGSRGGKLK